jgi:hypothetical protein
VRGGQPPPGPGQVDLLADEVVGRRGDERGWVGQPHRQRALPPGGPERVEEDAARDAEQPGPRIVGPRGQVGQPPPRHQERLRDDVLRVRRVDPALGEPQQVGVSGVVQLGEGGSGRRRHIPHLSVTPTSVSVVDERGRRKGARPLFRQLGFGGEGGTKGAAARDLGVVSGCGTDHALP